MPPPQMCPFLKICWLPTSINSACLLYEKQRRRRRNSTYHDDAFDGKEECKAECHLLHDQPAQGRTHHQLPLCQIVHVLKPFLHTTDVLYAHMTSLQQVISLIWRLDKALASTLELPEPWQRNCRWVCMNCQWSTRRSICNGREFRRGYGEGLHHQVSWKCWCWSPGVLVTQGGYLDWPLLFGHEQRVHLTFKLQQSSQSGVYKTWVLSQYTWCKQRDRGFKVLSPSNTQAPARKRS